VHPIAKPILIAVGGLLILWAAAILFVNIYLQSGAVQARLRDTISREVGEPAQIRQTYYTPWSGISISGLTIPSPTNSKLPLLEVQKIQVGVDFLALLQGRLVVQNLSLFSPSLAIRQPNTPAPTQKEEPETLIALPADHLPGDSSGLVQTQIPTASSKPAHQIPPAQIESFQIKNGRAAFFNTKGAKLLQVEGVFVDAKPNGKNKFKGNYRMSGGVLWDSINPRDFSGNFEWDSGQISLPDIKATLADGTLTGQFEWLPDQSFGFAAQIVKASLQKLAADSGVKTSGTQGALNAKIALEGIAGKPESLTGTAEVNLEEARMEPIELIRQLGELLRVDELRVLALKNAEAVFSIRDSSVIVEKLQLTSENLMIDAVGTARFNGDLDMKARLHVNEKLRKETRGLLGKNFQPSETEGYAHMPFSITGSLARPKSDLLDKMVGLKIGQDVGGLLNNLLRGPQKPKNKPAAEASPAP
jgi:hypothetical protein